MKLPNSSKYQSNLTNGSTIFYRFWCWRRVISSVILITFSSSLLSPVLASSRSSSIPQEAVSAVADKFKPKRDRGGSSLGKAGKARDTTIQPNVKNIKYKTVPISVTTSSPQESKNSLFTKENKYQPYLEMGGAKYFNQQANIAGIYDLFIPLLQTADQLFFTDLRIFDRSGGSFEGNAHLGYRKMCLDKKQLFGIYAAFDRKRSDNQHWFNQITLGAEYWHDHWFIGGNLYQPLGKNLQFIKKEGVVITEATSRTVYATATYEKSLPGVDAELGYAFTNNFTGYAGGYYFHASGVETIAGPKMRITYNYNQPQGRILGLLDGISIEVGAQYDNPRGKTGYLGIKFKVGLTNLDKNSNLFGFARHMTELVHRDPDVVLSKMELSHKSAITREPGKQSGDIDFFQKSGNEHKKSKEEIAAIRDQLNRSLEAFGLPKNATEKEVNAKWHQYGFKYHPDKNPKTAAQFMYYSKLRDDINNLMSILASDRHAADSKPPPPPYSQPQPSPPETSADHSPHESYQAPFFSGGNSEFKATTVFNNATIKLASPPLQVGEATTQPLSAPLRATGEAIQKIKASVNIPNNNIALKITTMQKNFASWSSVIIQGFIFTPLKLVNYAVEQFFDVLLPIKGAAALEVGPADLNPEQKSPDLPDPNDLNYQLKQHAENSS